MKLKIELFFIYEISKCYYFYVEYNGKVKQTNEFEHEIKYCWVEEGRGWEGKWRNFTSLLHYIVFANCT